MAELNKLRGENTFGEIKSGKIKIPRRLNEANDLWKYCHIPHCVIPKVMHHYRVLISTESQSNVTSNVLFSFTFMKSLLINAMNLQ